MKKKRILTALAAALAALLCVWRLWPHSLEELLGAGGSRFSAVMVQVSEFGISDGAPGIDVYRLEIDSPEDECYAPVLSLLQGTKFRQDLRNLLPWDILSVGSGPGNGNITHSAHVLLTWEEAEGTRRCLISFHGDRMVSIDLSGESEFLICHPTDRGVLGRLAAYTKEKGVPQG